MNREEQWRENFEAYQVEVLAREITLQLAPHTELRNATNPRETARALFNLGWRPPGYCECARPALNSVPLDVREGN